jgi:3-phosphoshikimate 1-carboxyvinyltransferase
VTTRSRSSGGPAKSNADLSAYLATLRRPLVKLPAQLALCPLPPITGERTVHITPPGSKSITNRAVLLAALAKGTSTLHGALVDADDAKVMLRAIQQLGAKVERQGTTLRIRGVAGRWKPKSSREVRLNLHNAGTATRFLAASALLSPVPIVIDGDARMRERPIRELADALTQLGATITYTRAEGLPPLRITPPKSRVKIEAPPQLVFTTTASSQFLSALLLVAPSLPHGITLTFRGEVTSESYITMTFALLRQLGLKVPVARAASRHGDDHARTIRVPPQPLQAFEYTVEADASGACPFLAAGALVPGFTVESHGVGGTHVSIQGDVYFQGVLYEMGANPTAGEDVITSVGPNSLAGVTYDYRDIPDTAMTAAVLCAFAKPTKHNPSATSVLAGLRTLRVKETDRVAAIATELRKLGVKVKVGLPNDPDALTITPPKGGVDCSPRAKRVVFKTYNDHRMAMSLALVGLLRPNVVIDNPTCVAKTYPKFWHDFARLYT